MRIAVIGAKGLPPKQGGIEHYCAEVYPRMVAQGHSVDLFARSSYTDLPWYYQYDFQGVRVVSLPSLNQFTGVDAFVSSILGAIAARGSTYDIVHFHALGPALFTWLPRLAAVSKVVVTCQGLDWQRAKWGKLSSRLIWLGEQAAVRYAHGITVVSEELQVYFKRTYGRETVYIPNGPAGYSDSDPHFRYGASLGLEPKKYILFLGRLVPEKRPDLLIQAYKNLPQTDWKLVFVGDNSETCAYTQDLLKMADYDPDIVFTGELRGSRLAEIVRGAGLFALPSDVEGLPLAMMEAMREGIPVVASDIPAHQQLVHEGRGVLFQAGNLEICTQALNWATNHLDEMEQMAERARAYLIANYNWDRITNETLQLYETILGTSEVIPQLRPVSKTQRE
jgi:glycosyltransferase involved in cell wall biosynthesis